MKKILIIMVLVMVLTGCTQQDLTRDFGGDMVITLEAGEKLEEIVWMDYNLWYLTRPMREGEEPETHIFRESSEFGKYEGTITIIEQAKEE